MKSFQMAERTFLVFLFVLVSIVETLLFAVPQVGWSSFIYVLIESGLYSSLCLGRNSTEQSDSATNSSTSTSTNRPLKSCVEQQDGLNLLYSVSQSSILILLISWGYLTYKYGSIKPKILSMILFIGGILLLGFTSPGYELLIVPGLIGVGVGGNGVLILNMKVTTLLNYGTGIYVGILNGAADSSVITFRFVKMLNDYGVKYLYVCIGIAGIHLVLGSISVTFHKIFISPQQVIEKNIQRPTQDRDEIPAILEEQESPTLKESVFSYMTFFYFLWFAILYTVMLAYVGTINKRLQDNFPEKVSYFTDVMANIMLGGIVSSFMVGGLIEWQTALFKSDREPGETKALQQVLHLFLSSIFAVFLNALSFITSEVTLYIEFVILTLFRALFFSSNMTFVLSMYPLNHTSVIYPLVKSIGGIFSTIQYGLFRWYNLYQGAETHVQIFMTALAALSLVNPIAVLIKGLGMTRPKVCCHNQVREKSTYMHLE